MVWTEQRPTAERKAQGPQLNAQLASLLAVLILLLAYMQMYGTAPA